MKKEDVFSIILSAELMMYGSLAVRLDKNADGVIASWLSIADGGDVVSNEKNIGHRELAMVVDKISEMEFDDEEDERMSICWSLQFRDRADEVLFSSSQGYWSRELLDRIIKELEEFLGDDEVLYDFNEILLW